MVPTPLARILSRCVAERAWGRNRKAVSRLMREWSTIPVYYVGAGWCPLFPHAERLQTLAHEIVVEAGVAWFCCFKMQRSFARAQAPGAVLCGRLLLPLLPHAHARARCARARALWRCFMAARYVASRCVIYKPTRKACWSTRSSRAGRATRFYQGSDRW